MTTKHAILFVVLVGLLLAAFTVTPRVGSIQFDPEQLPLVMEKLRMPRLYLAMIAGVGLALAGMTFQALFRNPLATPFTLGVSSGATMALAAALVLGLPLDWLGAARDSIVAAVGAMAVVALVYGVAQLRSESPTSTLLLAGVSINFICGAGIILSQYFANVHEARELVYWLLGSVEAADPQTNREMWLVAGLLVLCSATLIYLHRDLDLLMMGGTIAASRGVEVRRARALAYFCASLATAGVVALCGPIAFVGLLVPHTMRALFGPNHRLLIPACMLFGAALLPICDCIARNFMGWTTANNYTPLPVGVVTNILGGVFFLAVLIRRPNDRPIVA